MCKLTLAHTGLDSAGANLLAGLAMIIVSPLLSIPTGLEIWEPPKLVTVAILGPTALVEPGFAFIPVVTATSLHLVTAIVLVAVFGLVMHRWLHLTTDWRLPVYVGLVYGLLIFSAA